MIHRRIRPLAVAWLALPALAATSPAQSVVTPADRTGLALTVYSGWAQVRDTRAAAGADIVWTGVPATVDAATILSTGDGRPLSVVRQSYEAGEGEAAMLARSVGREVMLVWPDGTRQAAVLVSPDGPVFRIGDRALVGWDGPVELPAAGGLLEPAIRWTFDEPPRGALTANYLADGLSWSADYVAILGDDENSMWLAGHASVRNDTGIAWPDARLELVAGDVRRAGAGRPMYAEGIEMRMAVSDQAERQDLDDWHLYRVTEPITLAARSVARARLFDGAAVAVAREYVLHGQPWWFRSGAPPALQHPRILLRFVNHDIAGPDAPLPGGQLHTYLREGSELRFAGSAPVPDTPSGEEIELDVGSAFDIVAERTQTDFRQLDPRTHETAWRIEIRNRGDRRRTVTVLENVSGEWTIVSENHPHEAVDAGTVRWRLDVPGGGRATLEYRIRVVS